MTVRVWLVTVLLLILLVLLSTRVGRDSDSTLRLRVFQGRLTFIRSERGKNFSRSESWQLWPPRWPIPHGSESVSTP
jgi:hypothetical protein